MAQTMLASGMTDGQLDDLATKLRSAARKHRNELETEAVQEVLRSDNVGMRLFAEFRRLVEEVSKRIVHVVQVNRQRSPQESLDACGRVQYVDKKVVAAMPRGTGEKVKLVYFQLGPEERKSSHPTCEEVAEAYKKRRFKPDLQAQVDDNAANPEFADKTPNACQWVDAQGNYCYAAFDRWNVERDVRVDRRGSDWDGRWSFGGVPEEESSASAV